MSIQKDWLINPSNYNAEIKTSANGNQIELTNGLISRIFYLKSGFFTLEYTNVMRGESLIRGVKPEAELKINDKVYVIGGAKGQREYAYFLEEWVDTLEPLENSFEFVGFHSGPIRERIKWHKKRYASNTIYPANGLEIIFEFKHADFENILVQVIYELYSGVPLLTKRIVIKNISDKSIRLNSFTSEILAMVEATSTPQGNPNKDSGIRMMHTESDYIFAAMAPAVGDVTSVWAQDPDYTSQVAYLSDSLLLFRSEPPIGPEIDIHPKENFETFITYELIFDSFDRERRSLSQRKMYRTVAPWVTENPIFMHVITADPDVVSKVIDQCVELGYEMVILSFGCGISMEWDDDEFYEEFRELFDYAHSKGIEIGTYSLFSSRTVGAENDVIMPSADLNLQKSPVFGHAPCLQSEWGIDYIKRLKIFMEKTNADFLEHDGPYPGDLCASEKHPGHRDLYDSQWKQWKAQCELYQWCRERGIYINQPDWYFLNGGNKTGMGYKEVNWSLPRDRQIIIARQNIYDGTWDKPASMGWMFTPLTVYHQTGDWQESTLEPLSEHLFEFESHLSQNFLAGVQSCYRGNRLYDSEEVKQTIIKWVSLYKKHRAILDSDIIHIRRPDGRNIDGYIHVNPNLEEKGLLVLFNPTSNEKTETLRIPLYYTGLDTEALFVDETGDSKKYPIDRSYRVSLKVSIPPKSRRYFIIKN